MAPAFTSQDSTAGGAFLLPHCCFGLILFHSWVFISCTSIHDYHPFLCCKDYTMLGPQPCPCALDKSSPCLEHVLLI